MKLKLKFFMILALLLTTMTAGAYKVTLNYNYDGGPIYDTGDQGYYYTPPSASRTGHTFLGWSTSQYGPVEHAAGDMFSLTGDLTLYAVWDFSLKYTLSNGNTKTAQLTGYDGNKPMGALVIPASVTIEGNSYDVTSIGYSAFSYCSDLTSVTIPNGVTSIGGAAFYGCTNLTLVTLNSNPKIGVGAFPSGATVTMNLTGNEGKTGEYWMTFYNQNYNFQVPASGTKIFKASLSGTTLMLTELTADKRVNADNPVILKSTSNPIPLTLTSTNSDNNFDGNNLLGVDDAAGLSGSTNDIYVLNKKSAGVGFYKLASGKTLGVGKAYLQTTSGSNFFGMDEETTGLKSIDNGQWIMDNYYDLSGRKVENPKKGIYIHNGKKVAIK
jgi:Listeria-Bacteroides repeat domain (List_Bact_rpt).